MDAWYRGKRRYLLLWSLITVTFLVLYGKFVFAANIYAYTDIGADTVNAYLPNIIYDLRKIAAFDFNTYDLTRGLGDFSGTPLIKYLHPLNLPLLIFGEKNIKWGLIVSTYLRYLWMAIFADLYFRRVLTDGLASISAAMLWCFNGFAVLWGQHYSFLLTMASFTTALYGFQLFLERDRLAPLVVPAVACLAWASYPVLYVASIFFAFYGVIYLRIHEKPWHEVLSRALLFIGVAIAALGMASEYIIPNISKLMGSTRASVVGSQVVPPYYSIKYIGCFIGRFLSSDLLGIGGKYSGAGNYYEIAILSVSVLSIFSFVELTRSRYKRRFLLIFALCLIALGCPVVSQMLSFRALTQRWTFILCFLQVLMIGEAICLIREEVAGQNSPARLLTTVKYSAVLFLMLVCITYVIGKVSGYRVSRNTLTKLVIVFTSYAAFLMLYARILNRRATEEEHAYKRLLPLVQPLFLVLLIFDVCASNYFTINLRSYVSIDAWNNDLYSDGTSLVALSLRQKDGGTYRVNKTYDSQSFNDQLVQDYPGVGSYSSTNSAELVGAYSNFGTVRNNTSTTTGSNWIRFPHRSILSDRFLGVKYVITQDDDNMDPRFYDLVGMRGDKMLYRCSNFQGFGYLATHAVTKDQLSRMSPNERKLALTSGYYLTDGDSDSLGATGPSMDTVSDSIRKLNLLDRTVDNRGNIYKVDGVVPLKGGKHSPLCFDLGEDPGAEFGRMTIFLNSRKASALRVYATDDLGNPDAARSTSFSIHDGVGEYAIDLTDLGPSRYIVLSASDGVEADVYSIDLESISAETVESVFARQGSLGDIEITQHGAVFQGTVSNDSEGDAMLCLPLLYGSKWQLKLDGLTTPVVDVDGGMVGIRLSPGMHNLSLEYVDREQQLGVVISAVTTLAYAICILARGRLRTRGGRAEENSLPSA